MAKLDEDYWIKITGVMPKGRGYSVRYKELESLESYVESLTNIIGLLKRKERHIINPEALEECFSSWA
jgi:hypothetical protein